MEASNSPCVMLGDENKAKLDGGKCSLIADWAEGGIPSLTVMAVE